MPSATRLREGLLALAVASGGDVTPPAVLHQKVYRLATKLVPPSGTAARAVGAVAPESDAALLAAYLRGDARAIEVLIKRHQAWMTGWAARYLNRADAEEAAVDALMVLVHKAATLQPTGDLKGWLFKALRYKVLDAQRAARVRRGEPIDQDDGTVPVDPGPGPALQVLDRFELARVVEALDRVCDPLEQEIILFTIAGEPDAVIAEALKLSEGNVRVKRLRAREKIVKALGEDDDA